MCVYVEEDEDDQDAVNQALHAALAHELDPDTDVGLYDEDDDGFASHDDENLPDLEDTEDEEDWAEEWEAGGAVNDYQRNLNKFRVIHFSFVLY